jgi:flagellar hook-length control protein FliK
MDASQLVLLLSSRSHVAPKSAHGTGEDAAAAGDGFARLLRQKQIEHDQAATQKSSGTRQSRRASLASTTSSTETQTTSASDKVVSSERQVKATRQLRHLGQTTGTSPQQTPATGKPGRIAKDGATATTTDGNDTAGNPKADGAPDDATSDNAAPVITLATAANAPTDANPPSGDTPGDNLGGGGQQGQSGGDPSHDQQPTADPTSGIVASTEGLGALMAMLTAPVQPPVNPAAGSATTASAIGTNLPSQPTTATGAPVDPADAQSLPTAVAATATTPSQPAASANVALAIPAATTAPTTPQQASTSLPAPGIDLPATASSLPTAPAEAADVEASFANIVASKVDKSATGTENLRISATSAAPDKAAQLPRPLVRIDENRTPQATVQPAVTSPQPAPVTTAPEEVTPGSASSTTDYSSDSLRGFGSFSSLLPGSSAIAASKQPDMIAALRQQLANASIQDQVAVHIQRAVKDSADKISIQLSPEELGRIHVKMNVDDDKQVSASITVERPATVELLQRDTKALERALQEAGLKADSGSLSFSLQRGNQGDSSDTPGWGQSGGRQIGSSGQDKSAGTAETISAPLGNEIDTANGLVDVAV